MYLAQHTFNTRSINLVPLGLWGERRGPEVARWLANEASRPGRGGRM